MKLLIEKGANPHARMQQLGGITPVFFAATNGQTAAISKVVADPEALLLETSGSGQNILHFIAENCSDNRAVKALKNLPEAVVNTLKDRKDAANNTPLHFAAQRGKENVLGALLNIGAPTNVHNANGDTPLHSATLSGNVQTICGLVSANASVDAPNTVTGQTPLHYASLVVDAPVASLLLEAGANPNVKDNDGRSPLWMSLANNNCEVAQALVDRGGDLNATNKVGNTVLHLKVAQSPEDPENLKTVEWMLSKGADVNATNAAKQTPLIVAATTDSVGAVDVLLKHGSVDANKQDVNGSSAAHEAVANPSILSRVLPVADPNLTDAKGETPLLRGARLRVEQSVQILLNHPAVNPNAKDNLGRNALHLVLDSVTPQLAQSAENITRLLVAKDCDMNLRGPSGVTPVMVAASQPAAISSLTTLIQHTKFEDREDDSKNRVTHYAAEAKNVAAINHLLKVSGVEIDKPNAAGRTPILIAASKGCSPLVYTLGTSDRVDPRKTDASGKNIVQLAATSACVEAASAALAIAPEVLNQKDNQGNTALLLVAQMAEESDPDSTQATVARLLLNQGANVDAANNAGVAASQIKGASDDFHRTLEANRLKQLKAGNGELTFQLAWKDSSDLDLMVRTPLGQVIYYGNR
eukprot:c12683_g1_i2.p1 GENE.c12683_g1_i2~~c12683_g1_i2.p1  ORF type:complete len:641 (-),score=119.96 c12683_g1_i2:593-2515(-)